MAGTLTISTLSDGTNSTSSTNCIQGSARQWVQFAGATGTVNASYNTSSVTRNGTGDFTINFTNAFADTKYCYTVAAERTSNGSGDGPKCGVYFGGIATTSLRLLIPRQTSSSGEVYDANWPTVSASCYR